MGHDKLAHLWLCAHTQSVGESGAVIIESRCHIRKDSGYASPDNSGAKALYLTVEIALGRLPAGGHPGIQNYAATLEATGGAQAVDVGPQEHPPLVWPASIRQTTIFGVESYSWNCDTEQGSRLGGRQRVIWSGR